MATHVTPKMSQDEMLFRHLMEVGSITGVEAQTIYKARCVTSNIARLRAKGMNIHTEFKKDLSGQRYARYHCLDSKNCDRAIKKEVRANA